MTRANSDIRAAAQNAGIKLWMVAAEIGVSDATLTRRMRFELQADEKRQLMSAITEIIRLVEDDEYVFLFINKEGAYMLRKPNNSSAFQKYLTEKTGLEWIKPRNVFFLSLKQLKAERNNTKK